MKRPLLSSTITLVIGLMACCLMDAQAQSNYSLVEKVDINDEVVTFQMRKGNYADVTMTVAGPDEFWMEQTFSGRETPSIRVKSKKGTLPNGAYIVELTARPQISANQRSALTKAREQGNRYEMRKLMKEIGLDPSALVFSTHLGVIKGSFAMPEEEPEPEGSKTGALDGVHESHSQIQGVKLTGRRWDAAYLPNTANGYVAAPDVTGAAVQPAAQAAASFEDAPPFLQASANPAVAWYEATFENTAADGTPLTYQGFLQPVVTDTEGKLFQIVLRKADGAVYGPWQHGYFQADTGVFSTTTHGAQAQPFDYLTEENPEAAEAVMPTWHTGAGSIDGSLCVGFDCPSTPSFGFDTIRMQENNLRLHFDDTSTTASFPPNDWRVYANDSANGGSSYFGVEDATAGRFVFRVFAGARSNALTVDSQGDVGLGTTTPATDIDIKIGDTPTLRLQQDGTSGFTPQTWDVAGNEAGFFVRDATGGSTLPFRIITGGAPSQSLVIGSDGNVGIGADTSPTDALQVVGDLLVEGSNTNTASATAADLHIRDAATEVRIETTGTVAAEPASFRLLEGGGESFLFNLNPSSDAFTIRDVGAANDVLTINSAGDVTFSGSIAKGGGGFKIDHPLDPANKYLYHSFVESPDMMNVYNGNVVLDANGEATVTLPDWFEAINQDFRYQLTSIGGFAPVYIAEEIQRNQFRIGGGQPGMKISWQVTGVRHDPWAEQNRIPVEIDKGPDQGFYLHPNVYNQPIERAIGNRDSPFLEEAKQQ